MTTYRFLIGWLVCCAGLLNVAVCEAGPRVAVVMQDDAPTLEKHAAKELAAQWKQLFDADVQIGSTPPTDAIATILLGSPTTNPAVKTALGDKWPKLTDQGHLIRTVTPGQSTVVVGGDSPVATLWAVYELGHHFGVRSLLHGDYFPLETPKLSVEGLDIVKEPTIRTRAFRVVDMSPMSFGPWGLDDQKKLLSQLSKMKFNRIELLAVTVQSIRPVRLPSKDELGPEAFFPWDFPITGDVPGRKAFRGVKQFENPDLPRHESYDDRFRDGQQFVKSLTASAHERHLSVGMFLSMSYEVSPDGEHKENAAQKWKRFHTYLDTAHEVYPEMDAFYIDPPDTSDATSFQTPVFQKWKEIGVDVFVSQSSLKPVKILPSVGILTVPQELAKLSNTNRPHAAFLTFDSGNSVFPSLRHRKLPVALKALQEHHANGFIAVCETPVDIDPSLYYVSRAVFNPKLTFDSALQELISPICGEGVVDNVRLAFAAIDEANAILSKQAPNLGTDFDAVLGMNGDPPPVDAKWPGEVRTLFTNAMNEMYRANTRSRGGARAFTLYYARRFEFGLHFMTCAEAIYNANRATDREKELEYLEAAQEALYAAQNALADVARDQSDRGMIGFINLKAYQPLMQRLETLEKLVR